MNLKETREANWPPLEDAERIERVRSIVMEIAQRLKEPGDIEQFALAQEQEQIEQGKFYIKWDGLQLARGYSGLCLLFGELDRLEPDGQWDVTGHRYVVLMQQALERQGIESLSLWTGMAGVVTGIQALSRQGTRYENMLRSLNDFFLRMFPEYMYIVRRNIKEGALMSDYDVIQGLSGIGRYLLHFKEQPEMRLALTQVLEYMVELYEYKEVQNTQVPGWYISPDRIMSTSDQELYPEGYFNCGVSHGIPGPLALLSLAHQQGVEVEGGREAIRSVAEWLMRFTIKDEYGSYWPAHVSWQEQIAGAASGSPPREAWCYGGPGVARTLWLAGQALGEPAWKQAAIESFLGTARRPEQLWNLHSSTFCHGYAGLLQMTQRMIADTGTAELLPLRDHLVDRIIHSFDASAPYGFEELEAGEKQHFAGLLDGAAGVALTLLAVVQDREPEWDWIFLLK
ncbi:Lanthionine synthetase C-like protein [Paenibacillus tianmuensis]|uniref:Lanthionine synthetase C-like protein n=1 Tax=Paenibacillus tianmuensis TaxID=624147 RepID=A0A1G4R8K0_9BACL|nr:lanthionine synthetase C family protein [Paenibacillus tianmuensis]SCW52559.1 Lanthionine synthetase C-like protein [Paenibacillus tianmuensis]